MVSKIALHPVTFIKLRKSSQKFQPHCLYWQILLEFSFIYINVLLSNTYQFSFPTYILLIFFYYVIVCFSSLHSPDSLCAYIPESYFISLPHASLHTHVRSARTECLPTLLC